MARYSSGLNPDVVKTELDSVFQQEFNNVDTLPGWVDETSSKVFVQDTTDMGAVQEEVFKPTGFWDNKSEEEDAKLDTPRIGNKITTTILNPAQHVEIPKNFFDDQMHGSYEKMVKDFARKARLTKTRNAFGIYRGAFDSTTTADGAYLVSDTHTTLSGDTVDNKLTAQLSPSSLDTAMTKLLEQKDQNGDISGCMPRVLLVPPALFRTAKQIVGSEQEYGTANNNMEIYSSALGIYVVTNNYLGASAGGSDSAWFLLGDNHDIRRYVREGVTTHLRNWTESNNHSYVYIGRFREVYRAIDYVGVIGSDGTT